MRKGHLIEKIMEDQMQEKENERNARMDIIAQNGNDGEHYEGSFDVGRSGVDFTVDDHATYSWAMPVNYKLDVAMIHDLEDVKDVLEAMNLTLSVYREGTSPVQQRLINNGIFKK
jgi:hypothetical protein